MNKIVILFTIHELTVGGAEKTIVNIMNNLDKNKYSIHLCIFNNIGEFKRNLNNNIVVHDLQSISVSKGLLKLVKNIYQIQPDLVFSGISHLNLALSIVIPLIILNKKIKFIARETSIPSIHSKQEKNYKFHNILYKVFYRNFDLIICQSNFMLNDLIQSYKIPRNKLIVINNPVDIIKINKLSILNENLYQNTKINLVTVGRLEKVKGYDLLLKAIAILDNKFVLSIIGEGTEKENLKKQAKELKIEDRVNFEGFNSNPYSYMYQADLFILSSQYEGFPNVLLEANTCGIPIVAFDCPGGTSEIIQNYLNGILVEYGNIEELSIKIQEACQYNFNHNEIRNNIYNKYNINKIIKQYELAFEKALEIK